MTTMEQTPSDPTPIPILPKPEDPPKREPSNRATHSAIIPAYTPSGLIMRLSHHVETLSNSLTNSPGIIPKLSLIFLWLPLEVARFGLTRLERLLGIEHRNIRSAMRRSKRQEGDDAVFKNERDRPAFDFSASPKGDFIPTSPSKRYREEETDDSEIEDCEVSKTADLFNMLAEYNSEEDPDFIPEEESQTETEDSLSEAEPEETEFQLQAKSCGDGHDMLVELVDEDQNKLPASLGDQLDLPPVSPQFVQPCEPFRACENVQVATVKDVGFEKGDSNGAVEADRENEWPADIACEDS